jgi:hypothetical protein
VAVAGCAFADVLCLAILLLKGFSIQELVSEPAVEALTVGVLPRRSGFDAEHFEPASRDPLLHGLRHKLGAVVASDEVGRAPARHYGIVQDLDHVFGSHPPSVFGLIKDKVRVPHMVHTLGTQPLRPVFAVAVPRALALPHGHFEPFQPP